MEPETNEREPTLVNKSPTLLDEDWSRNRLNNNLDLENVENKAAPNYFPTISKFREAVAQLPQLKSEKYTYIVNNPLPTQGGESVVLSCSTDDGKSVVAKVYYEPINSESSSFSSRSKVLDYMRTEEGQKYTLAVLDAGVLEFGSSKYYFEITPYIADGDISGGGKFSFEEICNVTKQLNDALHSIHNFGLLHGDIKPSNIFKIDDRYVLGDFGIAKILDNGKASITNHIEGTFGYFAPELSLGVHSHTYIYDIKCEYFSLGVTLGSLFKGQDVFKGVSEEIRQDFVKRSCLPLSEDDNKEDDSKSESYNKRKLLENLFTGLVKYDSNERFGYEDVNNWLDNPNYTGNIRGMWRNPVNLLGKDFFDEKSLFYGITENEKTWEEGKKFLYTKIFERFFSFRTDLSREAQKIEEQYRNANADKGLSIFLKTLYPLGHIVWKGQNFKSLEELGNAIIDSPAPESYTDFFQNNIISHWLSNTEGIQVDDYTKKLVDNIEAMSNQESELACYWFGFSFAAKEKKILNICNKSITSYNELIEAIFSSPNTFYENVIDKILNRSKGADFYGFLYSLGCRDIIDERWNSIKQQDEFNALCILFIMLDSIAEKEKANTKIIRDFFINYGPLGFATYTKKLVEQNVYIPTNSDGKKLILEIQNFKEPAMGCVEELHTAYQPLLANIDKFTENLFDNPLCISAGIYENKAIVCTNLAGCFAYDFFGKKAPLGFKAYITNSNDVKKSILKTNKAIPKTQKRRSIRFVNILVFLLSLVVCGEIVFSVYQINPVFISSLISSVPSKETEPEIEYKEYYVLSDALNIRSEPNAESEIVITVVKNTKLIELDSDETSNWIHVKVEEKTGYVNKNYLGVVEEEAK